MSDKKIIKACEVITYIWTCPECEQAIYSDDRYAVDISHLLEKDQEVRCVSCGYEFIITLDD